jgi:hypothetical protein
MFLPKYGYGYLARMGRIKRSHVVPWAGPATGAETVSLMVVSVFGKEERMVCSKCRRHAHVKRLSTVVAKLPL